METRREASASALPLQGAVHLETSYISTNDRFAAQNCLCGGPLPAYIPVSYRLPFLSFQVLGLRLQEVTYVVGEFRLLWQSLDYRL